MAISASIRCTILLLLLTCFVLLTFFRTNSTHQTTTFSFKPVIPSVKQIDLMYASTEPPKPIHDKTPDFSSICNHVDFHWLASDRIYWDGWTSKSMFIRQDSQYTRKNIHINKDEFICVVVMLGPIPAVSSIKAVPHYAPPDAILTTAQSIDNKASIPIILYQHPTETNVYFAPVQFSVEGDWRIETTVQYRSYFWEQPMLHRYLPLQFESINRLTVTAATQDTHKQSRDGQLKENGQLWLKEKTATRFVPSWSLVDIREQNDRLPRVVHAWGDMHLKRNVLTLKKMLARSRLKTDDGCDDAHYFYEDDEVAFLRPLSGRVVGEQPVRLAPNSTLFFGDLTGVRLSDEVARGHRGKVDVFGIARQLPRPDVVLLGVGNEDLATARQDPLLFATSFASFLDFIVTQVYGASLVVVKTTQYVAAGGGSSGWNYGRSLAYANVVRATVAQLAEAGHRVVLWDTHQLGWKENDCGIERGFVSNHDVLEIENNLLFSTII
ncbi:MAG: hypothetical protein EXX96DRAFT_563008 [Benjaminiella poitrasii]|nr:MAG: hypothetical protein EXX96DRAFT_563008 [Benjaminiella poitrasii]